MEHTIDPMTDEERQGFENDRALLTEIVAAVPSRAGETTLQTIERWRQELAAAGITE